MAGRRDANLRQGDLAEELGILLLKRFCAVAPIPRQEDLGCDAIATILSKDGRFLLAGHSFWIQFKASSVRGGELDRAQYDWLLKLSLPLFVGSVDLNGGSLSIYSTHRLTCRADYKDHKRVLWFLDWHEWRAENGELHQSLGKPILECTIMEANSPEFRARASALLSGWVRLELTYRVLRDIGYTLWIDDWNTNAMPPEGSSVISGDPERLSYDLQAAEPYLKKIALQVLANRRELLNAPSLDNMTIILLDHLLSKHGIDSIKPFASVLIGELTGKQATIRVDFNFTQSESDNAQGVGS